jgi:hypothetical protein
MVLTGSVWARGLVFCMDVGVLPVCTEVSTLVLGRAVSAGLSGGDRAGGSVAGGHSACQLVAQGER